MLQDVKKRRKSTHVVAKYNEKNFEVNLLEPSLHNHHEANKNFRTYPTVHLKHCACMHQHRHAQSRKPNFRHGVGEGFQVSRSGDENYFFIQFSTSSLTIAISYGETT